MLHPDVAGAHQLAWRLEHAYYELMATTARHFGERFEGGFYMGVAGFDTPTMNRIVVHSPEASEADRVLRRGFEVFDSRAAPWSVVLPTCMPTATWHASLVARGFMFSSALHVLALTGGQKPPAPAEAAADVDVRVVRPNEMPLFTDMLLDVFQMPRRFYPALSDMTDAWRRCGATLYFAELDGAPVATALLARVEGVAGIYNVGTRRDHRRRGIAHALMARVLADAADADVVTLQVAPRSIAESFYLRLGFEESYSWRFYTPGPRAVAWSTKWNASPG